MSVNPTGEDPRVLRARARLVDKIAKMIGNETYNHAPINYSIAEKAIEIVEAHQRRRRRAVGNQPAQEDG